VDDGGVTWDSLDGGRTQIGLPADEILIITRDETLSAGQKLGALNALLQDRIRQAGLIASREALGDVQALVESWPITVPL
jgi:hypothetical protein